MERIFELSVRFQDSGNAFMKFIGNILYLIPKGYAARAERRRKGDEELEAEIERWREQSWQEFQEIMKEKKWEESGGER